MSKASDIDFAAIFGPPPTGHSVADNLQRIFTRMAYADYRLMRRVEELQAQVDALADEVRRLREGDSGAG